MNGNERTEAQARRNLQKYLRQLSYRDPDIPEISVDGVSSGETTQAIRAFQKKYGLSETGEADKETWDRIYDAYRHSQQTAAAPLPISPFPRTPENFALCPGAEGFLVYTVQHLLGALLLLFPSFSGLAETGKYDRATEDAIRELQARTLLDETGCVDRATWNEIVRLTRTLGIYT